MTKSSVIVADDDAGIRTVVTQALSRAGYDVISVASGAELMASVEAGKGDLLVTDVILPDDNGLELIPRIKSQREALPIIVMSAQTTLHTAVRATELGAFEYLPKPFDINELLGCVHRALEIKTDADHATETSVDDTLPIVGRSPAMQEIYRTIARLIGTDLTVMVIGESGTGKELVAKALHDYGHRAGQPFVAVNMAAIPRELVESELFGHEKGAFTGAIQAQPGRFAQADGGTLFLDEIGDMPADAQTRLLRVLQEGEYTSVGGRIPKKTNVRIIAATHRDLRQLIAEGRFREDLFFRLNVVPIHLPPLRDRLEDIDELTAYFLADAVAQGLPERRMSGGALRVLHEHTWPGNIRELQNLIQRLCVMASREVIDADLAAQALNASPGAPEEATRDNPGSGIGESIQRHLEGYFRAHRGRLPTPGLYDRVLHEMERPLLQITLNATQGNQVKAAEILGLNRNTLRKKVRELGIDVSRGREK